MSSEVQEEGHMQKGIREEEEEEAMLVEVGSKEQNHPCGHFGWNQKRDSCQFICFQQKIPVKPVQ